VDTPVCLSGDFRWLSGQRRDNAGTYMDAPQKASKPSCFLKIS
jgi:hypothetical protein